MFHSINENENVYVIIFRSMNHRPNESMVQTVKLLYNISLFYNDDFWYHNFVVPFNLNGDLQRLLGDLKL